MSARKNFYESPVLIILCLVYALVQLGFIICAAIADTGPSEVLNGGGWIYFYIVTIIMGIIANLYTFAVAALWGAIIIGVIVMIESLIACLIAWPIACLVLCCFLAMLGSSGSSSNNNRRNY